MTTSATNFQLLLVKSTLEISENLHHAFAVLSVFASAVGSQATITASFSIINQCQALGCFPRVKVVHTSDKIRGQVYVPDVNWLFMTLSIGITVGFRDIAPIGKATGMLYQKMNLKLFHMVLGYIMPKC